MILNWMWVLLNPEGQLQVLPCCRFLNIEPQLLKQNWVPERFPSSDFPFLEADFQDTPSKFKMEPENEGFQVRIFLS